MEQMDCPDCGRVMIPYKTKPDHYRCKCGTKAEQLNLLGKPKRKRGGHIEKTR